MSFTIATALSRLTTQQRSPFVTTYGTMNAAQQLQRINEILEGFYDEGDWRGLHATVSLTSTSGIITLVAAYLRLDGLGISANNFVIPIKNMAYAYQVAGPGIQDWTKYGKTLAIDMGDVGGVRQYQLTGDTTANDALAFTGLARKRYVYATDTTPTVIPDSYSALEIGVRAFAAKDASANDLYKDLWAQALARLAGNAEEFEAPQSAGILQFDPCFTAARIPNIL